mmetsp:Transcript_13831/g.37538  ORF Transcript_13831/g.37538 Transcript_13831/m.37538 type:complete len:277 (+) Transcript_13831:591-1421(+)
MALASSRALREGICRLPHSDVSREFHAAFESGAPMCEARSLPVIALAPFLERHEAGRATLTVSIERVKASIHPNADHKTLRPQRVDKLWPPIQHCSRENDSDEAVAQALSATNELAPSEKVLCRFAALSACVCASSSHFVLRPRYVKKPSSWGGKLVGRGLQLNHVRIDGLDRERLQDPSTQPAQTPLGNAFVGSDGCACEEPWPCNLPTGAAAAAHGEQGTALWRTSCAGGTQRANPQQLRRVRHARRAQGNAASHAHPPHTIHTRVAMGSCARA